MMYIIENEHDSGPVSYHVETDDGHITQCWTGQEMETAVWLSDCDATPVGTVRYDGMTTTIWSVAGAKGEPPFGIEYDEWIDARWAEVQDHQAMADDALEHSH